MLFICIYIYIYVCILSVNTKADVSYTSRVIYLFISIYIYIYTYICVFIPQAYTTSAFSYDSWLIYAYICTYTYISVNSRRIQPLISLESQLWVYKYGSTSKLNVVFAMFSYQISRDSSTSTLGASVSQQQQLHAPWMLHCRTHIPIYV